METVNVVGSIAPRPRWEADPFGGELQRARAHLFDMQVELGAARHHRVAWRDHPDFTDVAMSGFDLLVNQRKLTVLAALSWVWDAQERASDIPFASDTHLPDMLFKVLDRDVLRAIGLPLSVGSDPRPQQPKIRKARRAKK